MASFFGSVAQSVGQGMQENVEDRREDRRSDEEHSRELQLQKQRMAHETGLLNKRIGSDQKLQKRRYETESMFKDVEIQAGIDAAEAASKTRATEATTKHERDTAESGLERESKEKIARMGIYETRMRSGRTSSGGWDITVKTEPVFNQETGMPEDKQIILAQREGTPGVWRQDGDLMFRGNDQAAYQAALEEFPGLDDREMRYELEAILMQNLGDKEVETKFIKDYGYLPLQYFSALQATGDSYAEWEESFRGPTDEARIAAGGESGGALSRAAAQETATPATAPTTTPQPEATPVEVPTTTPQPEATVQPAADITDEDAAGVAKAVSEQMLSPWVHKAGEFFANYPSGWSEREVDVQNRER